MDEGYREKIHRLVKKYERVHFVHNGRSIEKGLDCLGFVLQFYEEFGIYLPESDGQPIDEKWFVTDPERYVRGLRSLPGREVSMKELKALDLVYFAISRDIITHTGVMLDSRTFAHMSPKSNFIISKMERHWANRFRGALRLIE